MTEKLKLWKVRRVRETERKREEKRKAQLARMSRKAQGMPPAEKRATGDGHATAADREREVRSRITLPRVRFLEK